LRYIIKGHKDTLSISCAKNVVYKISCNDCDAPYAGRTSRQLETHIKEHRSHINRNTTTQSVITNHKIYHNHNFKWNNIEIIDKELF